MTRNRLEGVNLLSKFQLPSSYCLGVIGDMWHLKCYTWHLRCDTWQMICGTWHVTGGRQWTFSQNFRFLAFVVWELEVTRDTRHMTGGRRWTLSQNFSSLALTVWELDVTCDTWHLRCGTWQMVCVTWHTGGDEHCVKLLGPLLLWFGFEGVLKILNERMNQLINDKGVCRSAPATMALSASGLA